ncbi:hypothetical protein VMT65_31845 [Nocardia sp. CDC153]|uniref:hypothetical protein n=1 Tax=Nocardia sp. CDC153 TaxID=3112167 RepID=UPI002DBCA0BA|nr:hypothetical protein [Nocardia sp. CDC153]MEC3957665.1 hypothetical protein [Nocardia sp. CDC153]
MHTKKTVRYAALGSALLAAAIPLSTGTATAASGTVSIWVGPGDGALGCQATTLACSLTAYVFDMTTPVTISVDGTTLATGTPVASSGTNEPGKLTTSWTPQTAGTHTVLAQQGGQSKSATVDIIGINSPEAIAKRTGAYLTQLLCNSGSSFAGSGECRLGVPGKAY